MSTFPATLLYRDLHNCFGYLSNVSEPSHAFQQKLFQLADVFRVTSLKCNNSFLLYVCEKYLTYKFDDSAKFLLLDTFFGQLQGFQNGEQVVMEKVKVYSYCSAVILRPITLQDWIKINEQAEFIEGNLLNQLQLVNEHSSYPIFLKDKLLCCVTVEKAETNSTSSYGILSQQTKVLINATVHDQLSYKYDKYRVPANRLAAVMNGLLIQPRSDFSAQVLDLSKPLTQSPQTLIKQTVRILPRSLFNGESSICCLHPTAIFIVSEGVSNAGDIRIVSIKDKSGDYCIYAVLFQLSEYDQSFRQIYNLLCKRKSHCVLSENLMNDVFSGFTWINYSSITSKDIGRCHKVLCFLSSADSSVDYTGPIYNFFIERCSYYPIVLSKEGFTAEIQYLGRTLNCRFVPYCQDEPLTKCYIFACDSLPEFEMIYSASEANSSKDRGLVERDNVKYCEMFSEPLCNGVNSLNLVIHDKCVDECTKLVAYLIDKVSKISSHLLLKGSKLSGKTTLMKTLARNLFSLSTPVYTEWINCVEWQGRSIDFIEKQVSTACKRLAIRRPSLLVLDDIDYGLMLKNETSLDVKILKAFSVIRRVTEQFCVVVAATTEGSDKFMDKILTSYGNRFFFRQLNIPILGRGERRKALEYFIGNSGLKFADVTYAVNKTESYVIGDIERLSKRIVYATKLRNADVVETNDVVEALREFLPVQQSQQIPSKKFHLSWGDVGGMEKVKKLLTEIFLWPSKYPKLYENCPIKIGRGALLYGPSGCGKTLIAKVVASESFFNVIHIKGPELLSKYVGQSEKNVRDVFERARKSKPCLIFFDEFDSLAIKRGNDYTGVTDRVVNQLLTELDGLEDREGVYVIATTTRLDLIDHAVIRPGRFDFLIECTLPNQDDRIAILKALTRKLRVHDSVDFQLIAIKTNKWSGADLKGLVSSAQFFAEFPMLNKINGFQSCGDNGTELRPEHFQSAFKEQEQSHLRYRRTGDGPLLNSMQKLRVSMA